MHCDNRCASSLGHIIQQGMRIRRAHVRSHVIVFYKKHKYEVRQFIIAGIRWIFICFALSDGRFTMCQTEIRDGNKLEKAINKSKLLRIFFSLNVCQVNAAWDVNASNEFNFDRGIAVEFSSTQQVHSASGLTGRINFIVKINRRLKEPLSRSYFLSFFAYSTHNTLGMFDFIVFFSSFVAKSNFNDSFQTWPILDFFQVRDGCGFFLESPPVT